MAGKAAWNWLALVALLAWAGTVGAGNARETRKQAESSMLVPGTVVIGEDGSVLAHELDPKIEIAPELRAFVAGAVAQWKFEPVQIDGRPARVKVTMDLRLVAKRTESGGGYEVRIASTHFGPSRPQPGTGVVIDRRSGPTYPQSAARMRARGTVYMLVRIGRDGHVIDVAAEQVNLRVAGTSQQMDQLRRDFAQSCTTALRQWTFKPPSQGPEAGRQEWVGRITVDFRMPEEGNWEPGKWETYIPGPRNTAIPWAEDKLRTAGSPDAVPEGGFEAIGSGPRLLTPLAG